MSRFGRIPLASRNKVVLRAGPHRDPADGLVGEILLLRVRETRCRRDSDAYRDRPRQPDSAGFAPAVYLGRRPASVTTPEKVAISARSILSCSSGVLGATT